MAYSVLVYSVQERLRNWVRRGSFLWRVLVGIKGFFRTLHQRLRARKWQASEAKFRAIVDTRAKATNDFFFIQIGAHDGIMDDPIHEWIERFGWRGIFVEPQRAPFNRLKTGYIKNGTSQRFSFENVAIAHQDGTCEMYKVDDNAVRNAPADGLSVAAPGSGTVHVCVDGHLGQGDRAVHHLRYPGATQSSEAHRSVAN